MTRRLAVAGARGGGRAADSWVNQIRDRQTRSPCTRRLVPRRWAPRRTATHAERPGCHGMGEVGLCLACGCALRALRARVDHRQECLCGWLRRPQAHRGAATFVSCDVPRPKRPVRSTRGYYGSRSGRRPLLRVSCFRPPFLLGGLRLACLAARLVF